MKHAGFKTAILPIRACSGLKNGKCSGDRPQVKANAFCSTVEKAAALATRRWVYLLLRYLISINIG
jgi:hypothetical protein